MELRVRAVRGIARGNAKGTGANADAGGVQSHGWDLVFDWSIAGLAGTNIGDSGTRSLYGEWRNFSNRGRIFAFCGGGIRDGLAASTREPQLFCICDGGSAAAAEK